VHKLFLTQFLGISIIISFFILTPANIDDHAAVWDLTSFLSPVTIIGDKGYI